MLQCLHGLLPVGGDLDFILPAGQQIFEDSANNRIVFNYQYFHRVAL